MRTAELRSLTRVTRSRIGATRNAKTNSMQAIRISRSVSQTSERIAASQNLVDVVSLPPRLVRRGALPAPGQAAAGIEIDITAGYGDAAADVPAPIRQALLLLVAHWYEHRDPVEVGAPDTLVPTSIGEPLAPYRMVSL